MLVPEKYLLQLRKSASAGAGSGGGSSRDGCSAAATAGSSDGDAELFADIVCRIGTSLFLSGKGNRELSEELVAVQTHCGVFAPLYSAIVVGCPARALVLGGSLRDVPGAEKASAARYVRGAEMLKLATLLMVTFRSGKSSEVGWTRTREPVFACLCSAASASAMQHNFATHTHLHSYIHVHIHTYERTFIHAYVHASILVDAHKHVRACSNTGFEPSMPVRRKHATAVAVLAGDDCLQSPATQSRSRKTTWSS